MKTFFLFSICILYCNFSWGQNLGLFIDSRDNNSYQFITIGTQTWMAENLKYLPSVSPVASGSSTSPYYYVYGYDGTNIDVAKSTSNYATYGVLYNWPAAMNGESSSNADPSGVQGICPNGWHLPSDQEWMVLEMFLGMSVTETNLTSWRMSGSVGTKLREEGTTHWQETNLGATNSSGFTALPGGRRYYNGIWDGIHDNANFWASFAGSSTNSWRRHLDRSSGGVSRDNSDHKFGCSVRCIKDEPVQANNAPIASFSVTPSTGNINTVFHFDASASQDQETVSDSLQVRWDWTNDGTWDTGFSKIKHIDHQFDTIRDYEVALEVKDTGGLTSKTTRIVCVLGEDFFTDSRDNNSYQYITIGTQTWMAENLKYLPSVSPSSIGTESTPCFYVYGFEGSSVSEAKGTANYATYGVLYNWSAAIAEFQSSALVPSGVQGICPNGWHLPSDGEWANLINSFGTDAGYKMKSTFGWNSGGNGDNSSGFTGLPGGYRNSGGGFSSIGGAGGYWSSSSESSTNAWLRDLGSDRSWVYRGHDSRKYGYSVRCIRDLPQVNSLPTASAGSDQFFNNSSVSGVEVRLDGSASFDPDEDNLTFSWILNNIQISTEPTHTIHLGIGIHRILLIVSDGISGESSDEVIITAGIPISVKLFSSTNQPIQGGIVQCYSGGWQNIGTTDEVGETNLVLPTGSYSFKMTYAGYTQQYSNIDISQVNPIVYQTIPMFVKMIKSDGSNHSEGEVSYYASGWNKFGSIDESSTGAACLELLPGDYSFKMTYKGYSRQISNVNITETNPLVYQTLNVTARLQNFVGLAIENGIAQYYASGWKDLGTTNTEGNTAGLELLPGTYSFKMNHLGYTEQKSDININEVNPILFQTINSGMVVKLLDSQGNGLGGAEVQFYASGWKTMGTTDAVGLTKPMDLLPGSYSFKMMYKGFSQEISNVNIEITNPLIYETINAVCRLQNSFGAGIEGGQTQFYASGWKDFGTTGSDGNTSGCELLPGTYSFRLTFGGYTEQKSNITIPTTNPIIFQTVNTVNNGMVVKLVDSFWNGIEGGVVQYYANGWKSFGTTGADGSTAPVELLPGIYSFKMTYLGYTQQISNLDIAIVNPLIYQTIPVKVISLKSDGSLHTEGDVQYYASGWKNFGSIDNGEVNLELLPGTYSFKLTYGGYTQQQSNINVTTMNPVVYQTLDMGVRFVKSDGIPHESGEVRYYASGWRYFGSIVPESNGEVHLELLPGNYSFKMTYAGYAQQFSNVNITQINPLLFQTLGLFGRTENTSGTGIPNSLIQYYASGWKILGNSDQDGNTSVLDLLPGIYSFKTTFRGVTQQQSNVNITQVNPIVFVFQDGGFTGFDDGSNTLIANNDFDKGSLAIYPNPFSDRTQIRYSLSKTQQVRLEIVNQLGQVIEKLVDAKQNPGQYELNWDGMDCSGSVLSNGIYHIRLIVGKNIQYAKIIFNH